MTYYVYRFFNTMNGKLYIGKTNNPRVRLSIHKSISDGGKIKYRQKFQAIHAALAKYKKMIEFKVIQGFTNEIDALAAEVYWINYYNSSNPRFGYNLTLGGDGNSGFKLSPKHKAALLASNVGKIVSSSTKEKLRLAAIIQNLAGERNHNASLSNKDILRIRELYSLGQYTQKQLGIIFNVDQTTISLIVNNKTYKAVK